MSEELNFLPVILLGGPGTRLYPLSNKKITKPFVKLQLHGKSLLEDTIDKLHLLNNCQGDNLLLVMNESQQLPTELSKFESCTLREPFSNDTAVAVARVAKLLCSQPEKIVLFLPSDHHIPSKGINNFIEDLREGLNLVSEDNIVLFGLEPSYPSTNYGYILNTHDKVTFFEKPHVNKACELIQQGSLWNAGIFACKIKTLLSAIPDNIFDWVNNPREGKASSFDVSVLEKYSNLTLFKTRQWYWNDVGTWETALPLMSYPDGTKLECSNTTIINPDNHEVVTIGCHNLLVVVNDGKIVIINRDKPYDNILKKYASNL